MEARNFAYWLQGYFELHPDHGPMTAEQVDCVRRHLALVFVHDIDPSAGGHQKQAQLNALHGPPLGPVYRC